MVDMMYITEWSDENKKQNKDNKFGIINLMGWELRWSASPF